MTAPANICVGGYDGTLAGLSLTEDTDKLLTLTARFCYTSHLSAIRSAALHEQTLATGGEDETIRLYDVQKRVELGTLFQHSGTVTALRFVRDGNRKLMLSASDDHSICIWQASDWTCLRELKGHASGVVDFDIHPSRKVMLSIAKDRAVFLWNLSRGKVVFSGKTKGGAASFVRWGGEDRYVVVAGERVSVCNVEGKKVWGWTEEKDVGGVAFWGDDVVTAGGDGVVRAWDEREGKARVLCKHEARVKDVCVVGDLVVSADVRGGVKICEREGVRLATNVGGGEMRLTCMTAGLEEEAEEVAEEEVAEEEVEEMETVTEKKVKLEGTASQRKRKKRKKAAAA